LLNDLPGQNKAGFRHFITIAAPDAIEKQKASRVYSADLLFI